jgi:hypothetical protein
VYNPWKVSHRACWPARTTKSDGRLRLASKTWSKHGRETAIDQGKGMVKTPVQGGCAARDLNPEPAD